MILDELASYLQAQGLGTVSTTIFKGIIPEDSVQWPTPDALIALFEVGGLPPVHVHTQAAASYEQPIVQVRARGTKNGYAAARTVAQQAFVALDSVKNQTLSGTMYLWIMAESTPRFLTWDDAGRPHFIFNVRCAKALT